LSLLLLLLPPAGLRLLSRFFFRGREFRPAADLLSFASPKESKQRKGDPTVCDPSASLQGNLRCSRFAGSRRTRFAQTAASPDPRNTPLLGAARGAWKPFGPSRCSATKPLRALRARSGWDFIWLGLAWLGLAIGYWLSAVGCSWPSAAKACWSPTPSGCAEERSVSRIRARPCLSEASLDETPRNVSTAGCPQRSGGTQPVGVAFLCLLSLAKQRK
jgi:hypothetical protein